MKKAIFTLLIAALAISVYGQSNDDGSERKHVKSKTSKDSRLKCHALYIVLSAGLNNNPGLLGLSIDVPVSQHISVEGGAGLSTWGSKLYVGGKYFLKPCHIGWAFGTGVTYNTGMADFQDNLPTVYGDTEPVDLKLAPQMNVLLAAYKYWSLGKGNSRFYIELGYSVPLISDKFTQIGGAPIDDQATRTMNLISPGGLIAAIGFSFGVK